MDFTYTPGSLEIEITFCEREGVGCGHDMFSLNRKVVDAEAVKEIEDGAVSVLVGLFGAADDKSYSCRIKSTVHVQENFCGTLLERNISTSGTFDSYADGHQPYTLEGERKRILTALRATWSAYLDLVGKMQVQAVDA